MDFFNDFLTDYVKTKIIKYDHKLSVSVLLSEALTVTLADAPSLC